MVERRGDGGGGDFFLFRLIFSLKILKFYFMTFISGNKSLIPESVVIGSR